jgi:hypothetical protein
MASLALPVEYLALIDVEVGPAATVMLACVSLKIGEGDLAPLWWRATFAAAGEFQSRAFRAPAPMALYLLEARLPLVAFGALPEQRLSVVNIVRGKALATTALRQLLRYFDSEAPTLCCLSATTCRTPLAARKVAPGRTPLVSFGALEIEFLMGIPVRLGQTSATALLRVGLDCSKIGPKRRRASFVTANPAPGLALPNDIVGLRRPSMSTTTDQRDSVLTAGYLPRNAAAATG